MMKTTPWIVAALLVSGGVVAQEAPAPMSLEEAIALARENNPDYRAQLNDELVADWGVRSAYAEFMPSVTAGGGLSYQAGGQARIGGYTAGDIGLAETPDYYYSSYNLSIGLGLSGADFYRVGQQKATRRSVRAQVETAAQTLEANVTRQYMAVLRTRDAVELSRAELGRAEANLALAEARYAVESATAIEAKQAEVERGRAEVNLLRSESSLHNQKVRLLELVGIDLDRDVELTSEVPVFQPDWSLEGLVEAALSGQPGLEAVRAQAESA
ncbi:MAG: TolC family protein, partial [Gemmatimonadota bacterium]